jgi:predicted DsbA family dithiol-disulfide isomerase
LYERLLERLFAAYFQRGEDIGDAATLQALAAEVGVPADRLADATGDAIPTPAGSPIAGVPHFLFNGRRSLSGAQDASLLLLAMSQAMQVPVATEAA